MPGVDGRSRARGRSAIVLAVYAAFLLIAQFEHHDLLCHFKTPRHCTSCVSSLVGADPDTATPTAAVNLADAGGAMAFHSVVDDILFAARSTGRSPPRA
jgi:hypothetical protein